MEKGSVNGASFTNFINLTWAPFFWTQIMLRVRVWRQCGTVVKDRGHHDMASQYGDTKGLF